jgi:ParB-like chromosome segregation protein Spo0J
LSSLADLTLDPQNARKHGARNLETIEAALREVGAGRSIVVDEDGVILAGNATVEAAAKAGLSKVKIVDTDADTIVALRRSGLSRKAKARLALFDNRAGELAEGWETEVLNQLIAGGVSVDDIWTSDELAALLKVKDAADAERLRDRFGVPPFSVLDARQGYWQDRKRAWLALGIESELGRGGGTWRESQTGSPIDRKRAYSEG